MKSKVTLEKYYVASRAAVVREIGNEYMIIPLETPSGMSNEPYILNRTGQAIWQGLDGRKSLRDMAAELAVRFDVPPKMIEKDMLEFVKQLLKMNLIIEVSRS